MNSHYDPKEFDANIRSVQRNILVKDRIRNTRIYYDGIFDFRSNGLIKRIGLLALAGLICLPALGVCISALHRLTVGLVSTNSVMMTIAVMVFVGLPALGSSFAAVWVALFLRPQPSSRLSFRHRQPKG